MAFPHDYMDVAVRRSGGRAMQEQLPSRLSILGQAPSLLIPQEIFARGHQGPQSPVITDTRFLSVVPCEIPFLLKCHFF